MRRKISESLEEWFESGRATCPMIFGARQVGKTYAVDDFARSHFKHYLKLDFVKDPSVSELFDGSLDVEEIILRLSSRYPRQRFIPGRTLLFFDEIQECPRARTALKYFAMDGRYKVIASSSLLGLHLKDVPLVPIGYEEPMYLGPMDFEEFLWAMDTNDILLENIRGHIIEMSPIGKELLDGMMSLFCRYLVVGGMPEAVLTFSKENKLDRVRMIQAKIVEGYLQDIEKYSDQKQKVRVKSCFNGIAPILSKQNKRFMFSEIERTTEYRVGMEYYGYSLDWLNMASIVLFCENLREMSEPLEERRIPNDFKVYMRDTGLLLSMYSDDVADKILNGDMGVNKGAIAENFVAEALSIQGRDLMFYGKRSENIEIDFVTMIDRRVTAIEVKSGNNRRSSSLNKAVANGSGAIMFETRDIFVDDKGVKHYPLFAAAFLDCIDRGRTSVPDTKELVGRLNELAARSTPGKGRTRADLRERSRHSSLPSGGYIFPRFLQVMMALWMAVRLPTTANHSIIIPSQESSNPKMSRNAYCPSATQSITYWISGNSVDSTTRSALPSSPA